MTERETPALRGFLEAYPVRLASRVATVEVARAVMRYRLDAAPLLPSAFEGVAVMELSPEIATAAASLGPPSLRTLDAIHVASAMSLGDELAAFVTYDTRQIEAATAAGLQVESPA